MRHIAFTKLALIALVAMGAWTPTNAANVVINTTNFPDAAFRSIVSSQYDKNGDGKLNDAEIMDLSVVDVQSENIVNLKGIELFTELKELRCDNNELETLDVSKTRNWKSSSVVVTS